MKRRLITLLIVVCLVAVLVPLTVSAEAPQNGWQQVDGDWYYYRDGNPVTEEVIKIGNVYYGFNWEGIMYTDQIFDCDGDVYGAKPDGSLYVNQWVQKYGDWYYFGAEGKGPYDFTKIGGVWYFFYWGRMASDEIVWSMDYQGYFVLNKAGTDSKRLSTAGWHQVYGSWYYMYDNGVEICPAAGEVLEIGGKPYAFHNTGKMASNEIVELYIPEIDDYQFYYVNASGIAVSDGWIQMNGNWYYLVDGAPYYGDIYQIGSKWYYFNYDGIMLDIPGPQTVYTDYYGDVEIYVNTDGTLKQNVWYYEKTAPEGAGWTYYDEYCQKVYGPMMIGSKWYYFDDFGKMITKDVVQTDVAGAMVFDANGVGTPVNGWFQHPVTKDWMFASQGQLAQGRHTIGSVTYFFDNQGFMVANCTQYMSGDYYAFDANGAMVCTPGWKSIDGGWVYVADETGALHRGWLELGGKLYLLDPYMEVCSTQYYHGDESWYAFGADGVGVKMTGNGWLHIGDFRVYQVNGAPAGDTWQYINGAWYYFYYDGEPFHSGTYEINGTLYLFDADGKMYTKGWLNLFDGGATCTYYADANGVARTGLQTIGGKQYCFDEYGTLYQEEFLDIGNAFYWCNSDGSIRTTLTPGWNQIGSKWYYLDVDEYGYPRLLKNCLKTIGGVTYGFGDDYAMCANGVRYAWWDWYMFDANGALLTGWQQIGGKWYYADPEADDPMIYWEGIYDINGVSYMFKDGYLQGGTYYEYEGFFTANNAGVVTDWQPYPNGWTYADGHLIYKKDGQYVTGWVGDYYVIDGIVQVNTGVRYNDAIYWLGKDGRYVKSGWINFQGEYFYAKAGGVLACNEWLKLGSTYYYFTGISMVCNDIVYIDGQFHEFDASGKWLGQVRNNLPTGNGWKQVDGKWYYLQNNLPITGLRQIGGTWYCFGYDGAMVTNAADGYDSKIYYFTASGARANYVGWKQISGKWCYFYQDHSMAIGPLQEGNKIYFFGWFDDTLDAPVMITNTGIAVDNRLYLVNGSGYCTGPATGNGWRQAGSNWYYLINSVPVVGRDMVIDGKIYAFNYNGAMIVNDIYEASTGNGVAFFGADGTAVTKAGWYKASNGLWVYVQAGGRICYDGIYKIGNATYSFRGGYWVE